MRKRIIKTVVRTLLTRTSREKAIEQAKRHRDAYLEIAEGLSGEAGSYPVEVPPMRGVDEDMRDWSFFQTMEHNTIVNRTMSAIVQQLANGESLSGAAIIDPKKDVMPAESVGEEALKAFRESVDAHIEVVATLGDLKGTETTPHPLFGSFDAHKWNAMFSFHLGLHLPQAKFVAEKARERFSIEE